MRNVRAPSADASHELFHQVSISEFFCCSAATLFVPKSVKSTIKCSLSSLLCSIHARPLSPATRCKQETGIRMQLRASLRYIHNESSMRAGVLVKKTC